MKTVLANLPEPEKSYLTTNSLAILDWGCAFGEGVAELAKAFPLSRVTGLDFSRPAIAEARIRNPGFEYIWSEDGAIPRNFDVIVTSNCLEHFDAPLAMSKKHLAACNTLYVVLVPYNEAPPLHPQHRVQFQVQSFPPARRILPAFISSRSLSTGSFGPASSFSFSMAATNMCGNLPGGPDTMPQVVAENSKLRETRSGSGRAPPSSRGTSFIAGQMPRSASATANVKEPTRRTPSVTVSDNEPTRRTPSVTACVNEPTQPQPRCKRNVRNRSRRWLRRSRSAFAR